MNKLESKVEIFTGIIMQMEKDSIIYPCELIERLNITSDECKRYFGYLEKVYIVGYDNDLKAYRIL